MFDDDLLGKIFTVPAAAWTAVLAFIAYLVRNRNERLRDINTERSSDWDRIRSERDVAREECDLVRDRWAESERQRVEWMGRAVKAERAYEGLLEGIGEARQEAQRIISAEREKDARKRNGGGDA